MATIVREALNADGMSVVIATGGQNYAGMNYAGMNYVGVNLIGTWVGTVKFYASQDGVNFTLIAMTPFASGTAVQSSTANGSWFHLVQNYLAFKAVFTRTSGTAIVTMSASADGSYQDAFLASTSRFVSQSVSSGATNVLTIAPQANRAWRLKTLVVSYSVAPAAGTLVTISDGASAVMWEAYVPPLTSFGAATVGGVYAVPLPADGLVNTPGNTLVITLAAPGGAVVSKVNAEISAA